MDDFTAMDDDGSIPLSLQLFTPSPVTNVQERTMHTEELGYLQSNHVAVDNDEIMHAPVNNVQPVDIGFSSSEKSKIRSHARMSNFFLAF